MSEALLAIRPPTYHVYDLDGGADIRESIRTHRGSFDQSVNFQLLVLDMSEAGTIDHLGTWLLSHGKRMSVFSTTSDFPDLFVYPPAVDGLMTLTMLPTIKLIDRSSIPEDPGFWGTLQKLFPRTVFVLADETTETDTPDEKLHRVLVVPELSEDFSVPSK